MMQAPCSAFVHGAYAGGNFNAAAVAGAVPASFLAGANGEPLSVHPVSSSFQFTSNGHHQHQVAPMPPGFAHGQLATLPIRVVPVQQSAAQAAQAALPAETVMTTSTASVAGIANVHVARSSTAMASGEEERADDTALPTAIQASWKVLELARMQMMQRPEHLPHFLVAHSHHHHDPSQPGGLCCGQRVIHHGVIPTIQTIDATPVCQSAYPMLHPAACHHMGVGDVMAPVNGWRDHLGAPLCNGASTATVPNPTTAPAFDRSNADAVTDEAASGDDRAISSSLQSSIALNGCAASSLVSSAMPPQNLTESADPTSARSAVVEEVQSSGDGGSYHRHADDNDDEDEESDMEIDVDGSVGDGDSSIGDIIGNGDSSEEDDDENGDGRPLSPDQLQAVKESMSQVWFTRKPDKDQLQDKGVKWKCGAWSAAESKMLQENIRKYLLDHKKETLREVVLVPKKEMRKDFYRIIAKGIDRPLFSVYRRVRRMCDEVKNGKYSPAEVDKLKELHAKYKKDWVQIGKLMGRSSSSVKDRFRLIKKPCSNGRWTEDEEGLLSRAVHEVTATPIGQYVEKAIAWSKVSAKVPSRSEKQCRFKWINFLCWKEQQGTEWVPQDELDLIEKIRALEVDDENAVDWASLARGWASVRSPQWLHSRWWSMKRIVPKPVLANHSDTMEYMRKMYPGVLERKAGKKASSDSKKNKKKKMPAKRASCDSLQSTPKSNSQLAEASSSSQEAPASASTSCEGQQSSASDDGN